MFLVFVSKRVAATAEHWMINAGAGKVRLVGKGFGHLSIDLNSGDFVGVWNLDTGEWAYRGKYIVEYGGKMVVKGG